MEVITLNVVILDLKKVVKTKWSLIHTWFAISQLGWSLKTFMHCMTHLL